MASGGGSPATRLSRRTVLATGASFAIVRTVRAAEGQDPVRFGLTPVVLDSNEQFQADLRAVFEDRLGRPVELVQRRSYQEIATLLLGGQLHAAWICGYPFVQFANRLSILAVPVYQGEPFYQSYLIANRTNPAATVEDLRGDVHAFSDPDSNSGHLVTRYLLARLGETPATFFRETFFTYGHRNVIRAVAAGLAGSGSAEGYVWDVVSEIEPELTDACQIVSRSDKHGWPPVAALTSRLGEPAVQGIGAALLGLEDSALGRRLLDLLRFDRFVAVGPEHYDSIAEIRRFVDMRS